MVPMVLLQACILPCPLMDLWVHTVHPTGPLLMGLWDHTVLHHLLWSEWTQGKRIMFFYAYISCLNKTLKAFLSF